MRFMVLVFALLFGLTQANRNFASEELRKAFAEYREAKSMQQKSSKAEKLIGVMGGAKEAMDPKIRDEILAALAEELKGSVEGAWQIAKILSAFKNDDGKPAAICLGVLANPNLTPVWADYIRILKDWRVDGATVVKSLLAGSAKLTSPEEGLGLIQSEFSSDGTAREAILKAAGEVSGKVGAAAFCMLPTFVQNNEDASGVADLFLRRVEADRTPDGLKTAQQFMNILLGEFKYLHFSGVLDDARAPGSRSCCLTRTPCCGKWRVFGFS